MPKEVKFENKEKNTIFSKIEENFNDYKRALDVARAMFIGLLGTLITIIKSSTLIEEIKNGTINIITVLPIILLVLSLLLGLLWLMASEYELNKLKSQVGESISRKKMTTITLSLIIPLFIFLLAALNNNIFYFSLVFFIYISIDVFTRKYVAISIISALYKNNYDFSDKNSISGCIYKYYVIRNFELRAYFSGGLTLLALLIAALGEFFIVQDINKEDLLLTSYFIQIFVIVFSEISIWIWRYPLYKCISLKEE